MEPIGRNFLMLRHDVLWEKEVNIVRFAFWRLHKIDGVSHPGLFFHRYLRRRRIFQFGKVKWISQKRIPIEAKIMTIIFVPFKVHLLCDSFHHPWPFFPLQKSEVILCHEDFTSESCTPPAQQPLQQLSPLTG